jgi:tRNA (guanine37-N1)-methyltransferase
VPVALGLIVKRHLGESAIHALAALHLINTDLKIMEEEGFIHIPLSRVLTGKETEELHQSIDEFKTTSIDFASRLRRPKTLIEALDEKIPPHLLVNLPRSFDIVGNIAILEIPSEIHDYSKLVGEALMEINKGIQTVMAKASAVGGPFRLRELEIIAGNKKTETMHRENGCTFLLDVSKVYFSPRLAYEHHRVANQTKDNEKVIDMFAGVGPFSILIAKTHMNTVVHAIDINPYAIHYIQESARINKIADRIVPILGDANDVINDRLSRIADRIIMNLPEKASQFLDAALKALKPSGGIIHFYTFYGGEKTTKAAEDMLKDAIQNLGGKVKSISGKIVKPSAPNEWLICIDAEVR